MPSRFSCTDFTFPLLAHEDALSLISMLGIGYVDIGFFQDRSHIQPAHVMENPEAEGGRLRTLLESKGLEAADVFLQSALDFTSIAVNHPQPEVRQIARRDFRCALEFARGCGSRHMTCLPGAVFSAEGEGASWQRACSELAWRVEQAGLYGITFGVEAHRGSVADTPEKAAKLVQDTPGLTLTLDYSHFIRGGFSQEEITPLLQYAGHLHVRGASPQMLQTPVKESAIDFDRLAGDLKQYGYKGILTLEYVYEDWEDNFRVDTVSETILLKRRLEQAGRELQ